MLALDDINADSGGESDEITGERSVVKPAEEAPLGELSDEHERAQLCARLRAGGYAVLRRPAAAASAVRARERVGKMLQAAPRELLARFHGAGPGPGQKHGYMDFSEEGFEVFEVRDHFDGRFQWPNVPGLRDAVEGARAALRAVALETLVAVLVNERVDPSDAVLARLLDRPVPPTSTGKATPSELAECSSSGMRMLRYDGNSGAGPRNGSPHTDNTLITAAPRADVPALQLAKRAEGGRESVWEAVEAQMGPDDVLVFAGDALCALTRGRYAAGLHRVPPGEYAGKWRMSTPYFLRARPGAELGMLTQDELERNVRNCRRSRPWMRSRADAEWYAQRIELLRSTESQH